MKLNLQNTADNQNEEKPKLRNQNDQNLVYRNLLLKFNCKSFEHYLRILTGKKDGQIKPQRLQKV